MSTKPTVPIFIVCGKSPLESYGGGYSTFARNLGKTLVQLGYRVYVVALSDTQNNQETEFGTLITVRTSILRVHTSALPGLPWFAYILANRIKNIMDEKHYARAIIWGIGPWGLTGSVLKLTARDAIIHINNYFTTTKHEWQGSLRALRVTDYGLMIRLKYVGIYHTVVRMLSFLEKIVLTTTDIIVTNYISTEHILMDQFHLSRNKFFRTPFPVSAYMRRTRSRRQKKGLPNQYILYLSRHDPRKGVNFLLRAMRILVSRGTAISLVIAGTGELFAANVKLAHALKLDHWVQFTGFIDNPLPLLQHATVFCLPTVEEGAGALIINEAMSLGLPIVTTICDGITEDIVNGKTGLLVEMGNSKALADGLEKLIRNPQLRKQLGSDAKQEFLKANDISHINNDTKRIVDRALRQLMRGAHT